MLVADKGEKPSPEPAGRVPQAHVLDSRSQHCIPDGLRKPAKSLHVLRSDRSDEDIALLNLRAHAENFLQARLNSPPRPIAELPDLSHLLAAEAVRKHSLGNGMLIFGVFQLYQFYGLRLM